MVVRLGHASSAGLVLDLTAEIVQWKPLVPQGVQGLCLPPLDCAESSEVPWPWAGTS